MKGSDLTKEIGIALSVGLFIVLLVLCIFIQ